MNILSVVGAFFKLVALFLKGAAEKDKIRQIKLKEAEDELREGIKKRDSGAVLRAISKSRRV